MATAKKIESSATTTTVNNPISGNAPTENPAPVRGNRTAAFAGIVAAKTRSATTGKDADHLLAELAELISYARTVDRSETICVGGVNFTPQQAVLALLGFGKLTPTRGDVAKVAKDTLKKD